MKNSGIGSGVIVGCVLILALVGLLVFRMLFVNSVDNYEVGYKYTLFGANKGKIEILSERGWIITPPFIVKVHTVDLRPMQVCINANQRVLNCKLIQFDEKGLGLFLSWHGRQNYEGPGGNQNVVTIFSEILKSYAYEGLGKEYPFLTVLRELKGEEKK